MNRPTFDTANAPSTDAAASDGWSGDAFLAPLGFTRRLEIALRFYMAICGNTAHSVTRESAQDAYAMAEKALASSDERHSEHE